jgi:hypothetical protein
MKDVKGFLRTEGEWRLEEGTKRCDQVSNKVKSVAYEVGLLKTDLNVSKELYKREDQKLHYLTEFKGYYERLLREMQRLNGEMDAVKEDLSRLEKLEYAMQAVEAQDTE